VDRLLTNFLGRLVRRGSFTVTTRTARATPSGDGSRPQVAVRFATAKAQRAVVLDPELKLGESYMDGTFRPEQGSIAEVLEILLSQDRIAARSGRCRTEFSATCSGVSSSSIHDAARVTMCAPLRPRCQALSALSRWRPAV